MFVEIQLTYLTKSKSILPKIWEYYFSCTFPKLYFYMIKFASKPQNSLIALSDNSAWNVVYGHVVLCQDDPEAVGEVTKKLYGDLCSQLHLSSLLPCLVDLCRSLCGIMQSYKSIYNWHLNQESSCENQEYVLKKLSNGFPRIWQDVQTKVN